jgi:hypothetical protein
VVTAGVTSRNVYLPAGRWLDYNSRNTNAQGGGTTITSAAPLGTTPLFVREGAIIARGDIVKSNNNWDANWSPKLRIEIFPSGASASRFDYFNGNTLTEIRSAPSGRGIEVTLGDLGAPGTVEVYWRNPTRVVRDGKPLRARTDYTYDPAARKLTLGFTGATKFQLEGGASVF